MSAEMTKEERLSAMLAAPSVVANLKHNLPKIGDPLKPILEQAIQSLLALWFQRVQDFSTMQNMKRDLAAAEHRIQQMEGVEEQRKARSGIIGDKVRERAEKKAAVTVEPECVAKWPLIAADGEKLAEIPMSEADVNSLTEKFATLPGRVYSISRKDDDGSEVSYNGVVVQRNEQGFHFRILR